MDKEKIIRIIDELIFEAQKESTWKAENALRCLKKELLKEQEAKPPIHVHEEYPEHDWVRKENGDIDEFAYDGDYHNGPMCKRCYYSFCIHCDPNGWNNEPCIIDEYKCPKCGHIISKGTKFCSNCGQAVRWE